MKIIKYFFLAAAALAAVGFIMTYEGRKPELPEAEGALPPEQMEAIKEAAKEKENQTLMDGAQTNQSNISKLAIEDLKIGGGEEVKKGDRVTVNYVGTFLNGEKFDSSYDRDQPFSFTAGAGQVIAGWERGILGMKVGGKRKLTVPPPLAYGETGVPGAIPPGAILVFEIELLKISSY